MDSPFIYNRPVTGRSFVGRKTEAGILSNLLRAGENVVIYEPPKAGKDSLLQQVLYDLKLASVQYGIVSLSLLNVRTVNDFCLSLGSALLKPFGTTRDDYAQLATELLGGTHLLFDPQDYEATGRILSLGWDLDNEDLRAVLALPYRLARRSAKKLYVHLDEFQNVMLTEDGDRICRILQEVFKARKPDDGAASYIMVGSAVNAMKDIFEHRHLFARQAERVEFGEIDIKDLADSVNRGFLSSGKVLDRGLLMGACQLLKCNPYYINFFASICDSLAKGYITEATLNEALADLLSVHEARFRQIMSDLTTFQVNLLRAIVDGNDRFSGADVINRYKLNSSANVRRLKDALCKKEIITFDADELPHFLDPLFEYWVTKRYFAL